MGPRRGETRSDRGSVTAEFAAVVPAVVVLLALCLAAVQVAAVQVRVADVAADSARMAARGDGASAATSHARGSIAGASVVIESRGQLVCVQIDAPASTTGPFAALRVSASSCALGSVP